MGQEDWVRETKKQIAELQKKLKAARKAGNWEEFVQIQKKLTALHEKLEREGEKGEKGERGGEDEELAEWGENLETRLRHMEREQQLEALERLIQQLKERGEHGKAKVASRLLKGLRGKEKKPKKAKKNERALRELEERMEELHRAIDKAEKDFNFERVDKLKKEIRSLEVKRAKIMKAMEKGGRSKRHEPEEMDEHLRELWKELKRAEKSGDKDRMREIQRKISEIRRGKFTPRRDRGEWREESLRVLEETIGKLKQWTDEARKVDDEVLVQGLEEGTAFLKDLWEGIERSRGEEGREEISAKLEKAIQDIHKDIQRMKEEGDEKRLEIATWAGKRLAQIWDIVKGQGRGRRVGPEGIERAVDVLNDVCKKWRGWVEEAIETGNEEMAREMKEGLARVEEFRNVLSRVRGPEMMDRIRGALEEGFQKMEREVEKSKEEGNPRKTEQLGWLLGKMRQVREALRPRERGGEPERRRAAMEERIELTREEIHKMLETAEELEERGERERAAELRQQAKKKERILQLLIQRMEQGERGHRGREGRRFGPSPEMEREIQELRMALRRAQEEGDTDRVNEIKKRILELQRHGETRREGRFPPEPRGADTLRETERLRKEIESLREELKALKKLLRQLLKEKEED
jgi:hypothetical protein